MPQISYGKSTTTISCDLYATVKKLMENDPRVTAASIYILCAATIEIIKNELFLFLEYCFSDEKLKPNWLRLAVLTEKEIDENLKEGSPFNKEDEEKYTRERKSLCITKIIVEVLNMLKTEDSKPFNAGDPIFQQIRLLFILRNEMIHFKFSYISPNLKKQESLINKHIIENEGRLDFNYPQNLFTEKGMNWAITLIPELANFILTQRFIIDHPRLILQNFVN